MPAFPTTVAQGLIWVYATPISELDYVFPDTSTIPLCEPLKDPSVVCLDVSRDLPYSYEHRELASGTCVLKAGWSVGALGVYGQNNQLTNHSFTP